MTYLDVTHVGNLIKIFKILNRTRKPCLSYIQPKHPSGLYHWWQLWGQMTNSQSSLFWEHTWSRILCASLPPWTRRIHVACFGQRNMSSSDVKHFWAGDWRASVGFATFSFLCLCYYGSKSIRRFLQLHLWIGRAELPDHPPSSVHTEIRMVVKPVGPGGVFTTAWPTPSWLICLLHPGYWPLEFYEAPLQSLSLGWNFPILVAFLLVLFFPHLFMHSYIKHMGQVKSLLSGSSHPSFDWVVSLSNIPLDPSQPVSYPTQQRKGKGWEKDAVLWGEPLRASMCVRVCLFLSLI